MTEAPLNICIWVEENFWQSLFRIKEKIYKKAAVVSTGMGREFWKLIFWVMTPGLTVVRRKL